MKDPLVSFLRGCAILMVLMVHSRWHFELSTIPSLFLKFGQMGCQIFFVLSSYCLCISYRQSGITDRVLFYKKRFLSIAPGYWLTMVLNICAYFIVGLITSEELMPINTRLGDIAINTFLLQGTMSSLQIKNFVVYGGWFVGVLVLFYVLFPLLYSVYFNANTLWKRIRVVAFPVITFLLCLTILILTSDPNGDIYVINSSSRYFSFFNQLPAFVMGIPLYELSQGRRRVRRKYWATVVLIVSLMATLLSFYLPFWYPFRIGYILSPFAMAVFASAMYFFLSFYYSNFSTKRFARIIEQLGTNSYGIYLSHFWVMIGGVQVLAYLVPCIVRESSSEVFYYLLLPATITISCILGCQYQKLIGIVRGLLQKLLFLKS